MEKVTGSDKGVSTAQETALDRLDIARTKLRFMTSAINELWGSEEKLYTRETIFGSHLIMHDIEQDFAAVQEALAEKK
jgi:hypothetical protein